MASDRMIKVRTSGSIVLDAYISEEEAQELWNNPNARIIVIHEYHAGDLSRKVDSGVRVISLAHDSASVVVKDHHSSFRRYMAETFNARAELGGQQVLGEGSDPDAALAGIPMPDEEPEEAESPGEWNGDTEPEVDDAAKVVEFSGSKTKRAK